MEEIYQRFGKFAHKAGLCNETGKYVAVLSVVPDLDDGPTQIITVQEYGISLPLPVALDSKVRLLEDCLGGEVYEISFGETTTQARFKFKSRKEEETA